MPNQRNANACICQQGASNPRKVAAVLVEAIDECRAEGVDPTTDPACFLILHQLAWIMGQRDIAKEHAEWQNAARAVGLVGMV